MKNGQYCECDEWTGTSNGSGLRWNSIRLVCPDFSEQDTFPVSVLKGQGQTDLPGCSACFGSVEFQFLCHCSGPEIFGLCDPLLANERGRRQENGGF